jgi:hypothetical protein
MKNIKGDLLSNCCHYDFDSFGFPKDGLYQEKCLKCGESCTPIWVEGEDADKDLKEKMYDDKNHKEKKTSKKTLTQEMAELHLAVIQLGGDIETLRAKLDTVLAGLKCQCCCHCRQSDRAWYQR